jgi:predicted RNase H-like nuclease (RuvC/YqgF family)
MAGYYFKIHRSVPLRLGVALILTGLFLVIELPPVAADSPSPAQASTTPHGDEFSTENLNKQINDLDAQIQKLRDQSSELQEKTRAKLQAQLEMLKKQQDTLIPRIEKLRTNSETAWEEIKENIQKAIEDLKNSVDAMNK